MQSSTPASQEWLAEEQLQIGKVEGSDDLPVRRLRRFIFYDNDNNLQPLQNIESHTLYGRGLASDMLDVSDEVPVVLNQLTRWIVEWTESREPLLWVRTDLGDYALGDPHPTYESHFDGLMRTLTIVNHLTDILEKSSSDAPYDSIIKKLQQELSWFTEQMLLQDAQLISEQVNLSKGRKPAFLRQMLKCASALPSQEPSASQDDPKKKDLLVHRSHSNDIETEEWPRPSQRSTRSTVTSASGSQRSKDKAPSDLEDSDGDPQAMVSTSNTTTTHLNGTSKGRKQDVAMSEAVNLPPPPAAATIEKKPAEEEEEEVEYEPIMPEGEFRNELEYRVDEEEAPEDRLELLGESELDPDNEGHFASTLPCRLMDDFVIFEACTRRIVPLSAFDASLVDRSPLSASGLVTRLVIDNVDDEDPDDDGSDDPPPVRMTTTTIVKWEIVPADGTIWIQTEFSFYRLLRPRAIYASFWNEWAFSLTLTTRLYKIFLRHTDISLDALLEKLSQRFRAYPEVTPRQLYERVSILIETLQQGDPPHRAPLQIEVCPALDELISKAATADIYDGTRTNPSSLPAWTTAADLNLGYDSAFDEKDVYEAGEQGGWDVGDFGEFESDEAEEEEDEEDEDHDGEGKRRRRRRKRRDGSKAQPTKRTPRVRLPKGQVRFTGIRGKDKHPATKTPLIEAIAKRILSVSQQEQNDGSVVVEDDKEKKDGETNKETSKKKQPRSAPPPVVSGKTQSRNHKWPKESSLETKTRRYFDEALVDGQLVTVGSYVRLYDGDQLRIARIMMLYEDLQLLGVRKCHCRFFVTGAETLLQETAAPEELFLTNQCVDTRLVNVIECVNVTFLPPTRDEKPPTTTGPDDYYYRYFYTHEDARFVDARKYEPLGEGVDHCPACDLRKEEQLFNKCVPKHELGRRVVDGKQRMMWKSVQKWKSLLSVGDFAYFTPFDPDDPETRRVWHTKLYEIGRIEAIMRSPEKEEQEPMIRYRLLRRVTDEELEDDLTNELGSAFDPSDRRELVLTNEVKTKQGGSMEGPCTVCLYSDVQEPDVYRHLEDCFYVKYRYDNDKMDGEKLQRITKEDKEIFSTPPRIPIRSDDVKLRAMDLFSGCGGFTVGMEKSGAVKTHWAVELDPSAAATFARNSPHTTVLNQDCNALLARAIRRAEGKEAQPAGQGTELPGPTEVDFLYCGPPCQGFSGINRFAKADDQLNDLIWTALSYCDFYRPRFFLLENVRGMVSFKLGGRQEGKNRIIGGIKMGVVKSIFRCLTAMGYQVHCALRQAGMHGLPQGRRRFFVWAARRNESLPDFPQPSTLFPLVKSITVKLPPRANERDGVSVTAMLRHAVPHAQVTVGDAISDLPPFEYESDPNFVVADAKMARASKHRNAGRFVGKDSQPYPCPPKSDYQRLLRSGGAIVVRQHYTKCFHNLNVERICHIPKRAGADHRDLPEALRPWCLSDKMSAASRHRDWKGLYGRLDMNGHFVTALTDISPMGKAGTVLHPNQNRVISVRESARAQGFPDDFIFESRPGFDTKPLYRQIGNAVPCPLAHALGKHLAAALFNTAVL